MNNNSCKYYTERTLGWMLNNKTIVILSLLSFSLFVSTLAIAGQRNRLSTELQDLKNSLTTLAPGQQTPAPEPATTTTLATPTDPPAAPENTDPPAGGGAGGDSKSNDDIPADSRGHMAELSASTS
ncbi:uncharacterized protein LOC113507184 [Trichoplusia ni]|uniref:Uncharacterized protein LOC113507184 n=1 Tax=Trichoplusia ni TaxID=7111 RepID=A0A7E5X052_TRINI|nr:uncharacterized protein LOC113507184 [Trichoplusia ni]